MALIGDTGVNAAIGDDQFPRFERGYNNVREMLRAIGLEKEGLGKRGDGQVGPVEQEVAYLDAEGRSPWLARAYVGYVTSCQPLLE